MIDVFKIGVSISATNNVSAALKVIQHDLFGLNHTVDLTQGKFDRLKLAIAGTMAAMGGIALLTGVGKTVLAGADVVQQQKLMASAGMSNLEIAQATAQAWQTTASVMGTAVTDNLKSISELRAAFSSAASLSGGNPAAAAAEAMKYLPVTLRAQMVLGTYLGNDARDQVYDYAKGLEMVGATQDTNRFSTLLSGMVRAAEASGGKVTGAGFFSAIKYGRTAALGWDNQFITDVLPLLIQEYGGTSGQGGPGNALMSAFQTVVGGTVKNKAAEEFYKLHLLKPGSVIFTTTGDVKGIRRGGIEGSSEFAANPYSWVQDYLMPALRKAHITDQRDIIQEISYLFGNRTASQMISTFATQQSRFQGSAILNNSAQGLDAWSTLINGDLISNVNAFQTSLGNLVRALGVPLVSAATQRLHALTIEINDLALLVSKHPEAVKIMAGFAIGLGTLAVAFGAFAVGAAAFTALGTLAGPAGLLGLAAGIVALGAAFDKIPGWVVSMAAGAAVGAAAGSVVPGIGTAAGAVAGAAAGAAAEVGGNLLFSGPHQRPLHPAIPVLHPAWRPGDAPDASQLMRTQSIVPPPPEPPTGSQKPIPVHVTNGRDLANGVTAQQARQLSGPIQGTTGADMRPTPQMPGNPGSP